MPKLLLKLISVIILMSILPAAQSPRAYAQDNCNSVIPYLVQVTNEQICREINENWICYGNKVVAANPSDQRFVAPADRQPIAIFVDLFPEMPLGLALMRVLSITDPTPINVIIFGELGVKSLDAATFEIAAESENLLCSDTPSGLVIQTDDGATGAVKINGIEIILGSTAFVTINSAGELTIANLEGEVTVVLPGGVPQPIPENEQIRVLASAPTTPIGPEPSPYVESAVLQFLALDPTGLRRIGDPNTGDPSLEANVPPCGGEIEFGDSVEEATFTLGQECLYTFRADQHNIATINMEAIEPGASSGQINPWIDLRAPDLHLLAHNNDVTEGDLNSRLCNIPLSTQGGVYTIVARAAGNDSKGSFRLQLEGQTSCLPPEPRCEVATAGLNLRSGPATIYPPVKVLPQGTQLRWLGRNDDSSWLYVEELDGDALGWVSADVHLAICEYGTPPPTVQTPIPPTVTPNVTPTPTNSAVPSVTGTPSPTCEPSILQQAHDLPCGDGPKKTETSPPPPPGLTPQAPARGTKEPNVPGP